MRQKKKGSYFPIEEKVGGNSLLEQITDKCAKSGKRYAFVDDSLRFPVDKYYPKKMIDLYSLDITEVEELLNIKLMNKTRMNNNQNIKVYYRDYVTFT